VPCPDPEHLIIICLPRRLAIC